MNYTRTLAFFCRKSIFSIYFVPICLLFLFLGFFSATFFTSLLAYQKNVLVFIAFFITLFIEIFGSFFYKLKKERNKVSSKKKTVFFSINYLKIGFIFGLFIDAFKLGS
jgi:hypothetical protein